MLGFRPVASAPLASGPLAEEAVAAAQAAQGRFDYDLWERKKKRIQVVLAAREAFSDRVSIWLNVEPVKPLPKRPDPPEVDLPIFDETFVSDLLLGRLSRQEEPKPAAVRRVPVVNAKGFTEALGKVSQPAVRSRKSRLPQRTPGTRRRLGQKVN